jgi:hypothetical protein
MKPWKCKQSHKECSNRSKHLESFQLPTVQNNGKLQQIIARNLLVSFLFRAVLKL